MEAEEFLKLKELQARKPRSILEEHWKDIEKLLDANCSITEVMEFLAKNGVSITLGGLSKYIKRHRVKEKGATKKDVELNIPIVEKADIDLPKAENETAILETSEMTETQALKKALNPKANDTFEKYEKATTQDRFKPKKIGESK